MSAETEARILHFEGFRLDSVRRTLHAPDGALVELKAKVFDTLLALVMRAGEVVPKSDLLEAVWPDVVVEENNLNQAVSALRKALAAHKPDNRIIVTVPGRGYQLAALVNTNPESPPQAPPGKTKLKPPSKHNDARRLIARPAAWAALLAVAVVLGVLALLVTRASPPSREPTVAVLPFSSFETNPEQDYFARGVAEETLNLLTQLDGLEVIARNSSFTYGPDADPREVGAALGVANVLSGSVRSGGGRLLVSAQLVDSRTGRAIWTREYSRSLSPDNVFEIQQLIARRVAGAMSITLGASRSGELTGQGTTSLAAYDEFLKGMDIWNRLSVGDSEQSFRRAIELDENYAAAWAGLAIRTAGSSWQQTSPEEAARVQAQAFEYAKHAVELDLNLSLAQSIYGAVACTQFDWIEAEKALARSVEIGRNADAISHRMMLRLRTGRISDANLDRLELERIDPLQAFGGIGNVSIRSAIGMHEEVLAEIDQAARSTGWSADTERLRLMAQINADVAPARIRDTVRGFAERGNSGVAQLFAALLEDFDDPAAARAVLAAGYDDASFSDSLKWDLIPFLAAWYGDDDLVLQIWYDELPINQVRTALIWGPAFDDVRARPEFVELMQLIGMDKYWRDVAWADKCRPLSETEFICE